MKLIRHKVPARALANDGAVLRTRPVSSPAELRQLLGEKLVEEAEEFRAAPSINELVDVYEALRCLLVANGLSLEDLNEAWREKRISHGGLYEGVVLLP